MCFPGCNSPVNVKTRLEGYDFDYTTADFGLIDEDIEMASESPTVAITAGEAATSKGPKIIVTAGEVVAGVPSQGHFVSPIIHDAHHSKEPPELLVESSGVTIKGMSLEEFLEKFAEDEENEKVATNFYPL